MESLADALRLLPTDRTEGLRRLEEALSDFPKTGDEEGVIPPLASLANALMLQGQADAAKKVADRALTLAARESNAPGRLLATAVVYSAIGEYAEAAARLREAENLASQASDVSTLTQVLVSLEYVLSMAGQWEDAARAHAKLLELTSTLDEAAAQILAFTSGQAHLARGEFIFAAEHFEQLLAIHKKQKDGIRTGEVHALLGHTYASAGDLQLADEHYRQALQIAREIGDEKKQAAILVGLSEVFYRTGDVARGVPALEEARRLAQQVGAGDLAAGADYSLGRLLSEFGESARAVEYLERALQAFRALGHLSVQADVLAELARVYARRGEVQRTVRYYEEAVRIAESSGDPGTSLDVELTGGDALGIARQTDAAIATLERARELARSQNDASKEGQALVNLGGVYRNEGRFQEALDSFRSALAIFERLRDLQGQGVVFFLIANAYEQMGRPDEELKLLPRALALARQVKDHHREVLALIAIASGYATFGDTEAEVAYLQEAASIAWSSQNLSGYVLAMRALASAYIRSGDLRRAEATAQDAVRLAEPHGGQEAGSALLALYEVYRELKREEGAADALARACKHLTAAPSSADWSNWCAIFFTDLLRGGNVPEKVRAAADAFLSSSSAERSSFPSLFALIGRAYLLLSEGETEGARRIALELRPRVGSEMDPALAAELRGALGGVLFGLRMFQEARVELAQAVELYDQVRALLPGDDLRARFLGTQKVQATYDLLILDLAFLHLENPALGYDREALFYHDHVQARSLREQLAEPPVRVVRDAAHAAKVETIQKQVEALRARRSSPGLAVEEARRLDLEIAEWLRELDRLRDTMRAARRPTPVAPSPKDFLAALQSQLLDKDTALIVFHLSKSETLAWAVTQEEVAMAALPPGLEVEAAARRFLFLLTQRDVKPLVREYAEAAALLYRNLLGDLEPTFRDKKHLLIVPDGILASIPFEALIGLHEPNGQPGLLLQFYSITYGPSAGVLLQLATAPQGNRTWTKELAVLADPAVGAEGAPQARGPSGTPPSIGEGGDSSPGSGTGTGPLPRLQHARVEAESIASLFPPGRADLYLGEAASRENVTASGRLAGVRILHFATHAIAEARRPAFSGLVLSPSAPREIGLPDPLRLGVDRSSVASGALLNLYEILDLDVNAELVVLSACETGRGPMVRGEGVFSLSRAFLYAGAQSVLASLWRVNDASTAELMVAFYRSFVLEGTPKAEALRKAKLALMADWRFASPYYWAPFVLVGR